MTRKQGALLAVVLVLLAIGAGAWWAWPRGPVRKWEGRPDHQVPEATLEDPEAADPAVLAQAFAHARAVLAGGSPAAFAGKGRPVWLCAYTPPAAPRCGRGDGDSLADAVGDAARTLGDGAEVLKLDVLLASEPAEWPADARPHEAGAYGLQVGGAVVLPSEVLERALFAPPKEDESPEWHHPTVRALLGERGATVGETFAFARLRTASWVQLRPDAAPVRLYRLHAWERRDPRDPAVLRDAALEAARHLASIVDGDGRIRYLWRTSAGRELSGYNVLRHAGSVFSLVQAWDAMREPAWREAAERALGWLVRKSKADERTGPYGGGRVRWLPEGSHVKLGGAALAAVAFATWEAATGDTRWVREQREFARFLVSQQQESGEFVYFAPKVPGGEPKDDTSAYYPGEAVLGLVLTFERDGDDAWLAAARRGADWLVDVRDAGKTPAKLENDHWLMIALSRLYVHTRDERYLAHARRLARAVAWQAEVHRGHEAFHRDYAGGYYEPPRSTPAATRAEGLVAVLDTCAAAGQACPEVRELLVDTLGHMLQCQYTPEALWWMPEPEKVAGGFAGGIVDPDLRNDYTQHALSALLGAARLLDSRDPTL